MSYYMKRCSKLEAIIHQKVNAWIKIKEIPLSLLASSAYTSMTALLGDAMHQSCLTIEAARRAYASKTLRGFQLIDDIKAKVEKRCPQTVSCADILTAAARDATILVGGPFWEVPFGQKDGRTSIAREADNIVPQGHENITSLINFFENDLGLTFVDMVILSGSHTIGRSSCHAISDRISNLKGTGRPDPTLNVYYLNLLRKWCRWDTNYVNLDATTPRKFDVAYYTNLRKKLGLLAADQLLYEDMRTGPLVQLLANQPEFFTGQFRGLYDQAW